MSKQSELNWYAFVVPAQKEYVAAYLLGRRFGCETYIPTETRWRRRNRYCKTKEEIAFTVAPRYVFAGFEGVPPWYFLFGLPLIRAVVGIADCPKQLDNRRLERFMRRVPNGHLTVDQKRHVVTRAKAPDAEQDMTTHREFSAGDSVEIVDGPFRDRIVTVHELRGAVAKIILPLFGADQEISVPVAHLESAA